MLEDFSDALAETAEITRHVLLGNGFSLAQGTIHSDYPSLLQESGLSPEGDIRRVFAQLDTVDFEEVMKALEHAAIIETAYGANDRAHLFNTDAANVREALIHAVRTVHPGIQFDIPEIQRTACAAFLSQFSTIFTLNYDLLFYWAILHGAAGQHSDGFGLIQVNNRFRKFSLDAHCSVYYLHGALHLFLDHENETLKRVVTNATIIDDIASTIRDTRRLPLFVAEGTASKKLRKINSVPYLRNARDQLKARNGAMFVFGHSANETDRHIYDALEQSDIGSVYFCVQQAREQLARERLALFSARNQDVAMHYVDAASANVWGPAA